MPSSGPPLDNAHTHLSTGVLSRIAHKGYRAVCSTGPDDWENVAVASEHSEGTIIPSFGIHPWLMDSESLAFLPAVEAYLLRYPQAGIGETGLDKTKRSKLPIDEQKLILKQHIDLAIRHNRVLSLHCVRAWGHLLDILTETRPPKILLHSWNGDSSLIRDFTSLGAYFSLGEASLKSPKNINGIQQIPASQLLIETDEHDVSLEELLNQLSLLRTGTSPVELQARLHQNFSTLFGL